MVDNDNYPSSYLVVMGELPSTLSGILKSDVGLEVPQRREITPEDYWRLWHTASEVVVVDYDNYETALMASVFASYKHVPLLLLHEGNMEYYLNLVVDRHMYRDNGLDLTVANYLYNQLGTGTVEEFTLSKLQKMYVNQTRTNKAVLVNPDDTGEEMAVQEDFTPDKSPGTQISKLYHRTSMVAPILASARQQVIIECSSQDYAVVAEDIKEAIQTFEDHVGSIGFAIEYLTIVAAPNAVPMAREVPTPWGVDDFIATDPTDYADPNGDGFYELAVGRIFGLTLSDVSSYVARVLHYVEIGNTAHTKKALFIAGPPETEYENLGNAEMAGALTEVFGKIGYEAEAIVLPEWGDSTNPADWKDKGLIVYMGHGEPQAAGINSDALPELSNSVVITEACLAAAWDKANTKHKLFAARAMRKGAVGLVGATDSTNFFDVWRFLHRVYGEGESLGRAFQRVKNIGTSYRLGEGDSLQQLYVGQTSNDLPHFILIGDPIFKVAKPFSFSKTIVESLGWGVKLRLTGHNFYFHGPDGEKQVLSTLPVRGTNCDCHLEIKFGAVGPVGPFDVLLLEEEGVVSDEQIGPSNLNWEKGKTADYLWLHTPKLHFEPEFNGTFNKVILTFTLE